MKSKFGIKTRVFLSFGFFVILITNAFAFLMIMIVENSFVNNVQAIIETEYEALKGVIDDSGKEIIRIPREISSRIEAEGLFFYIAYNDSKLIEEYYLGYYQYGDNMIFRGDYDGYNILIGKDISDLKEFKKGISETGLLLNIFGLFITFVISYFITNRVLKPLIKLSKFISNYEIDSDKTFIINKYGSSEIGLITESLNKFIKETKNTLESHKYFIQDASHELKTPLMQIESNIELIEGETDIDKIKSRLDNIKISLESINMIVSNLSFLVRGNEKLVTRDRINVGEYLEEFIEHYREEANKKKIKIELKREEKLLLDNNSYYLDRLFGNLISNSIAYNNGNNTIRIIVAGRQVIIEDEGIGISPEDINKIFNRFYRNKDSLLYNEKGNGLGLTIVKKILDEFAWSINIESEVNKYTRITITF